jgi:hypothetical protein
MDDNIVNITNGRIKYNELMNEYNYWRIRNPGHDIRIYTYLYWSPQKNKLQIFISS